jgi:hypothetical protein
MVTAFHFHVLPYSGRLMVAGPDRYVFDEMSLKEVFKQLALLCRGL